ncbi:MAG TPA: recombination mediator RecR [Spirochaetota bacterium]|nr:recombination mediator RecR [Spirochaetota bacterium]
MRDKSAIHNLINELTKLPGIGRRTAERLAFFILKEDEGLGRSIAEAILEVKRKVRFCSECGNLTEHDHCEICSDSRRNRGLVCVVEEPKDVWAVERIGTYRGLYHVLMGAISPLDGIGPEKLRIRELLKRIESGGIDEVIVATDPNVEGDATALYISKLIKPLGISVTRIASGLPVGGDLEYADSVTLSKALAGRRPL